MLSSGGTGSSRIECWLGLGEQQEGAWSLREAASNRQAQMDKRMRKTEHLLINEPVEGDDLNEEVDVLHLGFISTKGAIQEGVQRLKEAGHTAHHLQLRQLHPFPSETVQKAVHTGHF